MSYQAIICRLKNVHKHPNADRLQLAVAQGNQVIVGLNAKEDEIGVFFPSDGKLHKEYLQFNDLIARVDEDGNKVGGFFSEKGKVKCQKFRGERSEGLFMPLESLSYTKFPLDKLTEGTLFDELNGIKICEKYFTPQTKAQGQELKKKVKEVYVFPQHQDTPQLRHVINDIPANSIIYVTEKLHGTSQRYANCLQIKQLQHYLTFEFPYIKWLPFGRRKINLLLAAISDKWNDFVSRSTVQIRTRKYVHKIGTRRVILQEHKGTSFYGDEEFRHNVLSNIQGKLHKGEVIYGEVVGYQTSGKPIMPEVNTKCLGDKKFTKIYGDNFIYKYGQLAGTAKFYVYRISFVNEDGVEYDLPWRQVCKRARDLALDTVPFIDVIIDYNGMADWLTKTADYFSEGNSLLDESHIREGVVLRIEQPNGEIKYIKHKSFIFRTLESGAKDDDSYVDIEEAQG